MLDPNSTKTPTASTQDDNLSALADRIREGGVKVQKMVDAPINDLETLTRS